MHVDAQRAASIGVAQRILQQILHQLAQALRIALDGRIARRPRRQVELQRNALFHQARGEPLRGAAHRVGQIDRLHVEGQRAHVGQRQFVQIVDQLGQRPHLGLQRGERRGRERAHAVLERFQLAAQDGQRRAQLVRDVGGQLAAHLLVGFERLGQPVEIAGQVADLVARAHLDPRRVIALGHAARGMGQAAHRRQHAAREQHRHPRREQHRQRGDDPGGAQLLGQERLIGPLGHVQALRCRQPADNLALVMERVPLRARAGRRAVAGDRGTAGVEQPDRRMHAGPWPFAGRMHTGPLARRTHAQPPTGRLKRRATAGIRRRRTGWRASRWPITRRRAKGRYRLGGLATRAAKCRGVGTAHLAPDQAIPGLAIIAQEIPVAVFGIGRFDALGERRHALGLASVDVVEKVGVKTPTHRRAHCKRDDHAQREQRDEQLGGDAKRQAHESIRTTRWRNSGKRLRAGVSCHPRIHCRCR